MTTPDSTGRTKMLLLGALAFLVGFPVFVLLHNLFAALGTMAGGSAILSGLFGFLSAVSFLAALVLCPAGVAICLVVAALQRVPIRGPSWLRRTLLVVVPGVAAVGALLFLSHALSISDIERDEAAGLNGSFEVVSSGRPVNWYVYRRPLRDGRAEIAIDTVDVAHGVRSVRFRVREADPVGGNRAPGLFQVVDAEEGGTYDVSVRIRNRGSTVRLYVTSESPESREPRTPITDVVGPDRTGEDEWREFAYTYTVPAHYQNIRIQMNVVAPGTLWMDDVRIEPTSGG